MECGTTQCKIPLLIIFSNFIELIIYLFPIIRFQMWVQLITQLSFELIQEAICLFFINKLCKQVNNINTSSSTVIQIFMYVVYYLFIVVLYVLFSQYRNRPPILLTTYLLMILTLDVYQYFVINKSKQSSKQIVLPRKSTLLTSNTTQMNYQPINYEYSPQIQSQNLQFQSFFHSTPTELQSPILVAKQRKHSLSYSPKRDVQKSPPISPIISHPKQPKTGKFDSQTTTDNTHKNSNLPTQIHTVTKYIYSPTLTKRSQIKSNYPRFTDTTFSNTNNDMYLTPPKHNTETIKLRTFSTGSSNFNFWTNQIMRHIITPFSNSPQKRTDGPSGIRNIGNVCFMNSILQSLIVLPLFKSRLIYFSSKGLHNFGAHSRLIETMTSFMNDSNSLIHDPINIIRQLCIYAPNLLANPDNYIVMQSQQDAGEFFLFLIQVLNTAFHTFLIPNPVASEIIDKAIEKYQLPANLDFANLNTLIEIKNLALKQIETAIVSKGETYTDDLAILTELEWSIYGTSHYTPLYELFSGQLVEARYCMSCQGISLNLESFTLLPLSIPDTNKLLLPIEEILEMFSRIEGLQGRERLRCTRCEGTNTGHNFPEQTAVKNGLQDAQRRALLTKLPDYLAIQLSRFHFDPIQKFPYKNTKQISFPLKGLDLSQVHYDSVVNTASNSCLYELKSIVVHSNGSTALSGHYVSYTKYNNRWWLCNDSTVSLVDMEFEKSTNQILENTYLLFYAKQI